MTYWECLVHVLKWCGMIAWTSGTLITIWIGILDMGYGKKHGKWMIIGGIVSAIFLASFIMYRIQLLNS